MKKRLFSLFLVLVMICGLLPTSARAAGTPTITLNTNVRSANYTTSPYLTFTGSGATSQSAYTFYELTSNLAVVEGNQYIIKLNNYAAPASNAMDADYLRMDSLRINGTAITVPETETALPEIEGVTGTVNLANGAIVITMDAPTVDVTVDFSFIIETAKLQALIDQAEEIRNSDLYYSDGDYYNGYKYSNTSAWQNVFGTWGKLTQAKDAISREDLSVSEIKMYVEDLTPALNALVPKTQMNLGSLYKVFKKVAAELGVKDKKDDVDDFIEYPDDYYDDEYTRASWNACRAAFLEAFDYLNTLFTDRNTENAKPTEANKPENQLIADSYAKKLQMAYDGLMCVGEEEWYYSQAAANLTSLQAAVNGFKVLAAGLNEADYTPASWTVFRSAMTALNNVQLPAAVTTDEEYGAYVNVKNAYNEAYHTYYFTLTPAAQEITVHFRTMDPARARTADMKLFPGVLEYMYAPVEAGFCGTVTLSGAYTLADLAAAAGISMPAERGYWNVTYVGLFINGIYVTGDYVNPQTYDPNASGGRSYYYTLGGYTYTSGFQHVKLHPGDEVTLVYTPMTYSKQSPTIAFQDALLSQYMDDIRYEAFTAETIEVEAGETATVTITQTPASMLSSGSAAPAEGLQLYVSEKQESSGVNAPAKTIMLSGGEKIITDENGQADIRLYEEGWYLIAAYDTQEDIMGDQNQDTLAVTPGTYYSANSGAVAWVHVTAPADPTGVKKDLKDELTDAAAEYPEIIFRASDWQTIQTTVDDALTAIDEAETVSAAYSAQQTAMTAIRKIQNSTVSANTNKPAQFRTDLAKLPTDLNELTLGQQSIVNSLISCYESMSDYQKSLLTAGELSAYAAIAEKNEAGLPEAKEYALNVEVVADTAEATAIVQAMTAYLQKNAPTEDQVGSMEPNTLNTFCAFSPLKGFNDITSSAPLKQVQVFTNVDYAAYLLTRDADGHTISGDGWSISDNDDLTLEVKTGKYMSYDVIGHLTVMIDGIAYEIKSITFDGIDDQAVRSAENSFFDHSSYKGKDPESVNMYFANAYQTFTVPYNDVTATVTWGPVFENSPVGHLDAVYAGYSKAEYSSENWNALTKAYKDGRVAAVNAADDAAAAEACDAAIAAMAAIEKKDAADYGTVTVIVENTTYAAEDGAPWDGVLVDTTVALNEESTMMSAVVDALTAEGYTQTGAESNYISEINGLSEFDGGSDSGWMGTLNDWFNNEGFAAFTVAEGKLSDGDVIRIMYSRDGGIDLGGTWNNSDTTLAVLEISGGSFVTAFESGVSGSVNEFTVMIDGDSAMLSVIPTAANKNFLVKTFLNEKVTSNMEGSSFYKRTEAIPVVSGDTVYVGCGELAWPSMNHQAGNTQTNGGTWYVLHIVSNADGAKPVNAMIAKLPDSSKISYANYKSVQDEIDAIDAAIAELSENEQANVNTEKLDAVKAAVAKFAAIDEVKAMLAALPGADKLTENNKTDAQEAVEAYEALSDAQLDYFTVGEAGKYAAVKAWLDDMAAAAADGYTVTAPADISVAKGEEIAVSFTVDNADETVKAYNAFQLVLNYDPDMLTYSQVKLGETPVAPDSSMVQVSDEDGFLTIKGCGEDRTAPITVVFTDKAIGSSSVKVTEAKIDMAANAPTQDTPDATILDDVCEITVSGYPVSLDSNFTGEDVAKPGEAYTFIAKDKNYDYEVTVTVGGTPIEGVVDNGDGSFTIPADKITGAVEVTTAAKTPKTFGVTLSDELVNGADKATYLTDYSFTLKDVAGYTVSLDGITIGGTAYTLYTLTDGTYTIPGADITGTIAISAKKELIPVTETTVTFEGDAAGEIVGGATQKAELGKDFPFEINKDEAYDYTVKLGEVELLPGEDGKYVIPAAKLTGPVTVTIIKTAKSELTVKVAEYLKLGSSEESKTMWLVTAIGTLGEGKVYAYDGNAMLWSEKYDAYAWLVITEGSETLTVDAAKALVTEAMAAKTDVAYNFDVNMTSGVVDTNDAQLVYNMYNFYYNDFVTVSMEKFLRADLNGDKTINVSDAAAVVDHIMGK